MELNEKGKICIDSLFTNGFDRAGAYAVGFPNSTAKSRSSQMYQLLRRPAAKEYYAKKYEEYKEVLGVDKFTLVASLIKQVEFFSDVMRMADEGCTIENPRDDASITEEIDEWYARYGRMKDVMSASDNNKAKEMIAKLIGAFEPEKVIIEEKIYKVGFDFDDAEEV
tara:strand:- start:180 stop:680 length:501 start_codon:yes stop_codon:yes gene_type:complete